MKNLTYLPWLEKKYSRGFEYKLRMLDYSDVLIRNLTPTSSRACAYCDALEDPPDTTLNSCARCRLVFYCSKNYQAKHWKQKPAGHKQCFATPEERRPAASRLD